VAASVLETAWNSVAASVLETDHDSRKLVRLHVGGISKTSHFVMIRDEEDLRHGHLSLPSVAGFDNFHGYFRTIRKTLIPTVDQSEGNTWSGRQAGAESANAIATSC
jgi:hypothetical protein